MIDYDISDKIHIMTPAQMENKLINILIHLKWYDENIDLHEAGAITINNIRKTMEVICD